MTEFGPVAVNWEKSGSGLKFKISVPENCEAILALPEQKGSQFELDDKTATAGKRGARRMVVLQGGNHSGKT